MAGGDDREFVAQPDSTPPDVESLIQLVMEIVDGARNLPLSSAVRLDNKEEVLDLLEAACEQLPEETRQARWLMKERSEFLAKMQREGEDLVLAARQQAEAMVQRTEIVRQAQMNARQIVEAARTEAGRIRMEAEDYCDQKLAAFEAVLERTMTTVAAGRQKLAAPVTSPGSVPERRGGSVDLRGTDVTLGDEVLFDQDVR